MNNPAPASEALAYIRTLDAVEREILDEKLVGDAVVSRRHARAGPIVTRFGDWLDGENRTALPKSPFGQAVGYAVNQWPTLGRYLGDARFAIGRVEEWRGGESSDGILLGSGDVAARNDLPRVSRPDPSRLVGRFRFHSPLLEPDVRISRIRLSSGPSGLRIRRGDTAAGDRE